MMLDRRDFLQGSLLLAVGVGSLGKIQARGLADKLASSAFIEITVDSRVTIWVNKSEMGQGVLTALPQIVADELGAAWEMVHVEKAPFARKFFDPVSNSMDTGGSTSVRHMWQPLREAAAAARMMLVTAAAKNWGVSENQISLEGGELRGPEGRSTPMGTMVAAAAHLPVPGKPVLRQDHTLVGKALPRVDVDDKVTGRALFSSDVRLPDMLVAVLAHPPRFGASVAHLDASKARAVPGVRHVVQIPQGVAVVADDTMAAIRGRAALGVHWAGGETALDDAVLQQGLTRALEQPGLVARQGSQPTGPQLVAAEYQVPYLAHVPMEPLNCVVDLRKDHCRIIVGTQDPGAVAATAAAITGLSPERITIEIPYLGGGFGRRLATDYVAEALRIAKAIGKPVKLQHLREDDLAAGFFRPACASRIQASLDSSGAIHSWWQRIAAPSIYAMAVPNWPGGVDEAAVEGVANLPYRTGSLHVEWSHFDWPVPVWWWRSVGASHNVFMVESFIDELAHKAQADPLAFRLKLLEHDPIAQGVLRMAADKAGYGAAPSGKGRGMGMAYAHSFGSHCAQVVDASVDEGSGAIHVHRVVAALDCGPVVNPGIIAAQVEGGVIMGLSAALKEQVHFAEGAVASTNFHQYDILRMDEAPSIEVHLVGAQKAIGGVGEPGVPPAAPALANAIYAAMGARLRSLPMYPQAVRAALAERS
jgi:isoquinoline 1-oxidoreductase beta subunit